MALKMVKGSIDRMFDKNLQDLVRGIRNHKEDEGRKCFINSQTSEDPPDEGPGWSRTSDPSSLRRIEFSFVKQFCHKQLPKEHKCRMSRFLCIMSHSELVFSL